MSRVKLCWALVDLSSVMSVVPKDSPSCDIMIDSWKSSQSTPFTELHIMAPRRHRMGPEASGGTSDFKLNTHWMPHLSLVLSLSFSLSLSHTHTHAAETLPRRSGRRGWPARSSCLSPARPSQSWLHPPPQPLTRAKVLTVETPSTEPTFGQTGHHSAAYGLGLGPIGFGDGGN